MNSITVTTPDELKKAISARYDQIVVTGSLAQKVKQAEEIKELSPAVLAMFGGLGVLAVAAVAVPGLGTAAFAAAAVSVVAASGLSIPVLIIISIVGVTVLSMLFDEYTYVEVSAKKIIFERKRKSSN